MSEAVWWRPYIPPLSLHSHSPRIHLSSIRDMAPPYGRRSNACDICRQRRIKVRPYTTSSTNSLMTSITLQCDENQPACHQCLKARRTCTGAVQGNRFINWLMPVISHARSVPVPTCSVTITGHRANPSAGPSHAAKSLPLIDPCNHQVASHESHLSLPLDTFHSFSSDSQNLALPTWYQPSKSDIFQQHFTAHFVGNFFNPESFITPQNGWAHHLPSILSLVKSPAVEAAVRATTMAFYGIKADDVAIKAQACRWYCKGLRDQRIELERASSARSVHRLDVASALAPLLFSIFETFMVANPSGWIQHILAADRFLELLGPDACKDGLGHGLLRAVRLGAVSTPLILKASACIRYHVLFRLSPNGTVEQPS